MARKKKTPSFDIPASVRHAGQGGWVYRTRTREAAVPAATAAAQAPAAASAPPATAPPIVTGGLVGFGLQVAALPFMVPLYLTAAVSRRLGTSSGQ